MTVKSLTVAACVLMCAGAHSQAPDDTSAGLQSLASVRSAAEQGLRRELDSQLVGVELTAVPLDPRLRLPACAEKLATQAQPPRGSQARALVRVSCAAGASWSLNVPVDIRREVPVLVLRRAIARGEAITAADVGVQKRTLASLNSPYVAKIEELGGRLTRRPLPEGTLVTADALTAALLIHRGQDVTLTASAAGLEVRAPGRAMSDATANQRLRVQNLVSLKVVEGIAETGGVVRVSP